MSQSATLSSLPAKPQIPIQILAPLPRSTEPQESPQATTHLSGLLLKGPSLVTGDLPISQHEVDIFSATGQMAAALCLKACTFGTRRPQVSMMAVVATRVERLGRGQLLGLPALY